ncbi:hypothetical protein X798_07291 [Onchocerca flexuosa]|uniref:Uncharacterized protein n=1 Tax=Onchocerca flexuosa TaxID=387005 RepID=A0A238BL06_9BILA|nr:hypothetical protein X798_07291 [Onchocerca flexuosa]
MNYIALLRMMLHFWFIAVFINIVFAECGNRPYPKKPCPETPQPPCAETTDPYSPQEESEPPPEEPELPPEESDPLPEEPQPPPEEPQPQPKKPHELPPQAAIIHPPPITSKLQNSIICSESQ